jgi:hypothetical protein
MNVIKKKPANKSPGKEQSGHVSGVKKEGDETLQGTN